MNPVIMPPQQRFECSSVSGDGRGNQIDVRMIFSGRHQSLGEQIDHFLAGADVRMLFGCIREGNRPCER